MFILIFFFPSLFLPFRSIQWDSDTCISECFLPQARLFGSCLLVSHRGVFPHWPQIQSSLKITITACFGAHQILWMQPYFQYFTYCIRIILYTCLQLSWCSGLKIFSLPFLGISYSQEDRYLFFSNKCIHYIYVSLDNSQEVHVPCSHAYTHKYLYIFLFQKLRKTQAYT